MELNSRSHKHIDSVNHLWMALPPEAIEKLKSEKILLRLGKNTKIERHLLEVYSTVLDKIPGTTKEKDLQ